MPIYEYECESCGQFELLRPMSEASQPAVCPECRGASMRIMSMPRINTMSPLARMATERNEKSRHEPHVCTRGCNHSHAKSSSAKKPQGKTRHSYSGPRPWVIEHR